MHPSVLGAAPEVLALAERRLAELDRLRSIGMEQAETLSAVTRNLAGAPQAQYQAMVGTNGTIREFDRLNRAIRQIVVLEFEIKGLFKAPDRGGVLKPKLGDRRYDLMRDLDDYRDLFDDNREIRDINDLNDLRVRLDYRKDPVDRLIADIRAMLGTFAPDDDPFAPDAERKAREALARRENAVVDRVAARLKGRSGPLPRRQSMQVRTPEMLAQPVAGTVAAAKPIPSKTGLPRNGFRVPPTSPHNANTPRKKRRNRGPPR